MEEILNEEVIESEVIENKELVENEEFIETEPMPVEPVMKAIYVDGMRILSIADISAVEVSPNGLTYIGVEYVEPPVTESNLQKAYPMYDGEKMYWVVVDYQEGANTLLVANEVLKKQVGELQTNLANTQEQLELAQEALDVVLMQGVSVASGSVQSEQAVSANDGGGAE